MCIERAVRNGRAYVGIADVYPLSIQCTLYYSLWYVHVGPPICNVGHAIYILNVYRISCTYGNLYVHRTCCMY